MADLSDWNANVAFKRWGFDVQNTSQADTLSHLSNVAGDIYREYGPEYLALTSQAVNSYYSDGRVQDEDFVLPDRKLASPQPFIMDELILTPLEEQGKTAVALSNSEAQGSTITTAVRNDESRSEMKKIPWESLGLKEPKEIRAPFPKRLKKNERPFIIEMMDSSYRKMAIQLSDGTVVQALKLAPNPQTLTLNSSKIVTRGNTMTRWVEEHWGDELDTITFSGNSFSFFAYQTEGAPDAGLTVQYRNYTKPYQQLRELAWLIHYNGVIYQDGKTYSGTDTEAVKNFLTDPDNKKFVNNHPLEGLVKERLYIHIFFDYLSAIGYFETFDVAEESANPFKFTYNVIFKAEKVTWNQGSLAQ